MSVRKSETTRQRVRPATGGANAAAAASELAPLGAMGKAFTLLEHVARSPEPVTLSELVRLSGLTKPTAHRIVTTLADQGFIERDPVRRAYVEGPRLVRLALDALASSAPRNLRHAVLRSVSETAGETCNFGVLAGSEVIYLDRVEAKWPLGLRLEAGSRVPAHCTAIGKLLLALLPEEERARTLAVMPLARYTSRSITDAVRLEAHLASIREAGVGTDEQEFIDGVVCVSVPVVTGGGKVIGAIAISAPHARVDLAELRRHVPAMRKAATRLAATFID